MNRFFSLLSICLIVILHCSCKSGQQKDPPMFPEEPDQDQLIDMNRMLIREYASSIREYGKGQGWNLTETNTGLYYQIVEHNRKGSVAERRVQSGDTVSLNYSVHLIDGTLCYSSTQQGPKTFIVDQSEAEQGLHQAVKLMEIGDSATFMIPPYLAFGLVGDGRKIPGRAILVYRVRLESSGHSKGL